MGHDFGVATAREDIYVIKTSTTRSTRGTKRSVIGVGALARQASYSTYAYTMIKVGAYVARLVMADLFVKIKGGLVDLICFLRFFLTFFVTKVRVQIVFFNANSMYLFCFVITYTLLGTGRLMMISFIYRVALAFIGVPGSHGVTDQLSSCATGEDHRVATPLAVYCSGVGCLLSSASIGSTSCALKSPPLLPMKLPPFN